MGVAAGVGTGVAVVGAGVGDGLAIGGSGVGTGEPVAAGDGAGVGVAAGGGAGAGVAAEGGAGRTAASAPERAHRRSGMGVPANASTSHLIPDDLAQVEASVGLGSCICAVVEQ